MLLVVIDFQERIAKHIKGIEKVLKNTRKLIKAFEIFGMPIIYTKQINLGETVFGKDAIEKSSFSCWREEKFVEEVEKIGSNGVIITGIETHICVIQTAMDMKKAGYDVEVAIDCTGSRDEEQKKIAIERMKQEGIKLTSSEMVIYSVMKDANHPKFKDILPLIKE